MGEPGSPGPALRIERGRADEDELAALVVALYSVLAERGAAGAGKVPTALSRGRAEWFAEVYRSPRSWR